MFAFLSAVNIILKQEMDRGKFPEKSGYCDMA